ncbi:unnamed protein product [Pseudo-nitzschia multistriata]|uniref:Uncharacterized protein n=1 Tax=Pseudo-nitzschia multistriata TaxID=183589 RepID=A0A448YYS5_9STRA|nr:unnamed protein product [Pseudo-nitzschia multistriata]
MEEEALVPTPQGLPAEGSKARPPRRRKHSSLALAASFAIALGTAEGFGVRPLPVAPPACPGRGKQKPPQGPTGACAKARAGVGSPVRDDAAEARPGPCPTDAAHQRVRSADPEWYREYVSGILGEDYCADRWPRDETVVSEEEAEAETETETGEGPAAAQEQEQTLQAPPPPQQQSLEGDAAAARDNEDRVLVLENETPATTEATIQNDATGEVGESGGGIGSLEDSLEKDDAPLVATEDLPSADSHSEIPGSSGAPAATAEASRDGDAEPTATAAGGTDPAPGTAKTETKRQAGRDPDPRAVVYRNITGNAMTYAPLSDLFDLGYTVSDLERMQSEFLSIVVLDGRNRPSMGVPVQWKVKDPAAPPETRIVDSVGEASRIASEINQEERRERDLVGKRRLRQEQRNAQGVGAREGPPAKPKQKPPQPLEKQRSPRRTAEPAGRSPPERRNRNGGRRGERDAGGAFRGRDRNEDPRLRRKRGRRESTDGDGKPKRIYSARREARQDSGPALEDPPDINSPVWVNIDTFRDLLRKESELRMMFLGEDWDETIEQENNWRTELYKKWLWSLHNGVGDSIVPPTRTERAQKYRQKGRPRRPDTEPPPGRRKRAAMGASQRQSRSRGRGSAPRARRPGDRPVGGPGSQRRPQRAPGDGGEDPPRRPRRRPERGREPPPDRTRAEN